MNSATNREGPLLQSVPIFLAPVNIETMPFRGTVAISSPPLPRPSHCRRCPGLFAVIERSACRIIENRRRRTQVRRYVGGCRIQDGSCGSNGPMFRSADKLTPKMEATYTTQPAWIPQRLQQQNWGWHALVAHAPATSKCHPAPVGPGEPHADADCMA